MTKIIAHRGASAYCPENTFYAFEKAYEQNSYGIELDIHQSKDGELVVFHDFTLERITNTKGWIKNLRLSEIKQFDVGSWFDVAFKDAKIPTLNEVLIFLSNKKMFLNIEIKAGSRLYPKIEEKLINKIYEHNYQNNVIISSFDHYSLKKIREIDPILNTGVLYASSIIEPWKYAHEILKANALHPHYFTVDKDLIHNSKLIGLQINPYTVDDPNAIKELALSKVDNIITNHPDIAIKTINSI